jgi:phospholipase C
MGIYINNKLLYTVNGAKLNTSFALPSGSPKTVVEAWDKCGNGYPVSLNLKVVSANATTVSIGASPASIAPGATSTLNVTAINATAVTLTAPGSVSYPMQPNGGTATVSPTATTTYTATATGSSGTVTATFTVTVVSLPAATVTLVANPSSIAAGNSSTLTVVATNDTSVSVIDSEGNLYPLKASGGGSLTVTPTAPTTYTATALSSGGNATATATVTVGPAQTSEPINHVIFLQQENHTFDNYFGMLNPYRKANGWNRGDDGNEYDVDGIDDKLTKIKNVSAEGVTYAPFKFVSTCTDDNSSDWLASFGDVNPYSRGASRPILMNGFVHNAEGYAKSCYASGTCSGKFTDLTGLRAMGYYDQTYLNYYYWLASQFAVSDRWFSPVASKSVDNRLATFSGGTTQGLIRDPGGDDHLSALEIPTIFQELDKAHVSWKVYFTVTEGFCLEEDECAGGFASYPATFFSNFTYSWQYLHTNPGTCTAPLVESSVIGDASNSFCINLAHVAPISTYYTDLINGTLPSFSFIEPGYGNNDEHPGSGQSVLLGQAEVAKLVNALMSSSSWSDSVFFLTYDEGGGPYDHVPPVPGHSNDFTDAALGSIPDISTIAVNPDSYIPCVPVGGVPTTHCDLTATEQGSQPTDVSYTQGFAAQIGFRVPNAIISPFTRRHYVSHTPIDHTAIIKFVENRFIGPTAHLTARDAAQPNLMEFFDFTNVPWAAPPTPPAPVTKETLGFDPCTASKM